MGMGVRGKVVGKRDQNYKSQNTNSKEHSKLKAQRRGVVVFWASELKFDP
jgi:hypothetical protein